MTHTSKYETKSTRRQARSDIKWAAKHLVELAGHLVNLSDVRYLTIDSEWIGAVYVDEDGSQGPGALLKYRNIDDD